MTIYAITERFNSEEITAYCLGKCGHGIMAVIAGHPDEFWGQLTGEMMPCRRDDCPYEKGRTEVFGRVEGEPICIRALVPIGEALRGQAE